MRSRVGLGRSQLRLCCRRLARPSPRRGAAAAAAASPATVSARHSSTARPRARKKGGMALGAVASVAAVAALLREAQLPDRFAEWDDEVGGRRR
ncbi:unnamed protein product [Ectocarpus sp. CCAP 1310/34]|nr:unnamed protein product [Ectocarpus sp. CCAP 1310/34]